MKHHAHRPTTDVDQALKLWGGGGGGGGGGAIFEPKTLSMYLKKRSTFKNKIKKNMMEPGLEPTTSGLEKPALLSTRLNTTGCQKKTITLLINQYLFLYYGLNWYSYVFNID